MWNHDRSEFSKVLACRTKPSGSSASSISPTDSASLYILDLCDLELITSVACACAVMSVCKCVRAHGRTCIHNITGIVGLRGVVGLVALVGLTGVVGLIVYNMCMSTISLAQPCRVLSYPPSDLVLLLLLLLLPASTSFHLSYLSTS